VTVTASDSSKLQFLLEAALAIASGLELEDVLARMVSLACQLTDARYGALGVIDSTGLGLERFITHGVDQETRDAIGPEPKGRGILGVLITDARPLRLADLAQDPRSSGFPPNHPPMGSFLGVPVAVGGSVFGNLYLTEKAGGEFTEEDERLVITLAAQTGVAIQNAHLFVQLREHADALERAVTQLSSIRELNEAILSGQPTGRILNLIANQLRTAAQCRLVTIALVDAIGATLRVEAAAGDGSERLIGLEMPVHASKSGMALRARRTVRVDDLRTDPQVHRGSADVIGARTSVLCPLVYRDQAVGVLVVYDPIDDTAFTDDDVRVVELFGARATLALGMSRALQTERERAEAEALLLGAEQREQARRETLRRVVEAQEAERRRIARELHDDTGQSLATVLMGLRMAEEAEDPADARRMLADLRGTITDSIRDLRALAVELRPTALDDFGLGPALERLTETYARRTGLDVDVHLANLDPRLPEAVETAVFRIVQEALTNIAKHAGATRVSVVAQRQGDRVMLVVEDDGRGFDTALPNGGLGLVSIRERAELLGGNLRLESSVDQGTTIAIEIPT
jgi:signal transduction histidine kinase